MARQSPPVDRAAWASLRAHFETVSSQPPETRARYVHELRQTDPTIAEMLQDLLAFEEDHFLSGPTLQLAPQEQSNEVTRAFQVGDVLDERFEIRALLGEGGWGEVYRAYDRHRQTEIALKTIRPALAFDQSAVTTLRNELNTATRVSHPNVCRLYDIKIAPFGKGASFITMELLVGESLAARIRRQLFTAQKAFPVVAQIVKGLAAAHACGVVHRDLKSGNILLVKAGPRVRAVITDFGLAREIRPGAERTISLSHHVVGTPAYMAPEQLEGKRPTQAVDVHALGVILFEMVTGRLPFEGDTVLAIAAARLNHEAPNPRLYAPALDVHWERTILSCLDRDPAKRPATALSILSMLKRPSVRSSFAAAATLSEGPANVQEGANAGVPSIAVLPFVDMSAGNDQEYFCDGVAEEIINALSQIEGLRVVSRTSAFRFKGQRLSAREIGGLLNVNSLLEGSVRKAGEHLRITVLLTDTATGYQIWTQRYDLLVKDVFVIQDEIARSLVANLRVQLVGDGKQRLVHAPTRNPEAYNLYLKGRFSWNKRTADGLAKSVEYFQQAIAEDNAFGLAYAGLADSYVSLGHHAPVPPHALWPKAKTASLKALELDPKLSAAHAALGSVLAMFDWDWQGAEREFQRALELSGGSATVRQMYASNFLSPRGRLDEALAQMHLAQELDPLSVVIGSSLGALHHLRREFQQAVNTLLPVVELEPNFPFAHWCLGRAYEQLRMYPEALAAFHKAHALTNGYPMMISAIGYCHALSGNRAEALEALRELERRSERGYVSPLNPAVIYIALGEHDTAFEWLEKSCAERAMWLLWLSVEPRYDALRSDPRLAALQRRMGLPVIDPRSKQ